jgi:hypothetical protein
MGAQPILYKKEKNVGWLTFFLGLTAGTLIGVIIMSLLFLASDHPGPSGQVPAVLPDQRNLP